MTSLLFKSEKRSTTLPTKGIIALGHSDDFEHIQTYPTSHPFFQSGLATLGKQLYLFPHLSVADNLKVVAKQQRHQRVNFQHDSLMEWFAIRPLLHHSVDQLNYSERLRVALARACSSQPRALLLNDVAWPRSRDDERMISNALREVAKIIPILFFSSDLKIVAALADYIWQDHVEEQPMLSVFDHFSATTNTVINDIKLNVLPAKLACAENANGMSEIQLGDTLLTTDLIPVNQRIVDRIWLPFDGLSFSRQVINGTSHLNQISMTLKGIDEWNTSHLSVVLSQPLFEVKALIPRIAAQSLQLQPSQSLFVQFNSILLP